MAMVRVLPQPSYMTFTELTIVYVSCGAPFAVERLLSAKHTNQVRAAILSILHLCFWPAFLLIRLIRVMESRFVSRINESDPKIPEPAVSHIHKMQRDLTVLIAAPGDRRSALQINELLDRYSGLALLSADSQNKPSTLNSEFARISDHPSPALAAACRNRRNTSVIQNHLASARYEFLDLIAAAMADPAREESIVLTAADFVRQFDPPAVNQLEQLHVRHENRAMVRSLPVPVRFEESRVAP